MNILDTDINFYELRQNTQSKFHTTVLEFIKPRVIGFTIFHFTRRALYDVKSEREIINLILL